LILELVNLVEVSLLIARFV